MHISYSWCTVFTNIWWLEYFCIQILPILSLSDEICINRMTKSEKVQQFREFLRFSYRKQNAFAYRQQQNCIIKKKNLQKTKIIWLPTIISWKYGPICIDSNQNIYIKYSWWINIKEIRTSKSGNISTIGSILPHFHW